jgi:hypothetical protein
MAALDPRQFRRPATKLLDPFTFTAAPDWVWTCPDCPEEEGKPLLQFNTPEGTKDLPLCPNCGSANIRKNEPQFSFTLRCRELDGMDQLAAFGLATSWAAKYAIDVNLSPEFLAPMDGKAVIVSEKGCEIAALLFKAQVYDDPRDQYPMESLLCFQAWDSVLKTMIEACDTIRAGVESTRPLAPKKRPEPSLISHQSEATPSVTPQ